ncbi:MAG: hypothetical protein AAFP69_20140 [Planctomycetota bacterium]
MLVTVSLWFLSIGVACQRVSADMVIALTADAVNSSASGFSGSLAGTLADGFTYDPRDPTDILPQQGYVFDWSSFHASEANNVDALLSYELVAPHTIATNDRTVINDLYGRDNFTDRDVDYDIFL